MAGYSGLSLTPTSTTSPASRISTLEVHPYFSLKTLVRDFPNKSVRNLSPTNTTAGQDATDAFYGLHRHEVLAKPAYQRLIIGRIVDEEPVIKMRELGAVSTVPYAEPTWLNDGSDCTYKELFLKYVLSMPVCIAVGLTRDHYSAILQE